MVQIKKKVKDYDDREIFVSFSGGKRLNGSCRI